MSRPSASQSAQDMSMAFLRLFEYAVRTSAMAISSTMVSSAFLISSCRMGSLSSRVANLTSRVDHDVAVGVEVGGAVGRHQRGRVVFVDEQGTGPRPLVEILSPDDRRADHAVAGTEVGLALAAAGPRTGYEAGLATHVRGPAHARGQAQVDDLDRVALGLVAVGALVLLVERLGEAAERVEADGGGSQGDTELEGLPLVLEIRAALDLHAVRAVALRAQQGLRLPLERGERLHQITRLEAGERPEKGPHEVMLHLRLEQPERAPHPGRGRHEHPRDLERAGHLCREERPVAAEGDQGELLRIAPALDGDGADGARHARAAEQVDAVRGLGQPEAERRAHLLG